VTADVALDAGLDTEDIDGYITEIENALMETEPQVHKVYIEPEV